MRWHGRLKMIPPSISYHEGLQLWRTWLPHVWTGVLQPLNFYSIHVTNTSYLVTQNINHTHSFMTWYHYYRWYTLKFLIFYFKNACRHIDFVMRWLPVWKTPAHAWACPPLATRGSWWVRLPRGIKRGMVLEDLEEALSLRVGTSGCSCSSHTP